jgi:iron complex transport system ATP-binding protein
VGYHGRPVVKDIEASVKKGQIASLIGPNASGKSTILKTMASQLKTISGVALINDAPLEAINSRKLARQMAIVSTERPQPELMTCGELVAVGRYPYTGRLGILTDEDKEKIAEALSLVKALELIDRDLAEVSDGQLQRIMLARGALPGAGNHHFGRADFLLRYTLCGGNPRCFAAASY